MSLYVRAIDEMSNHTAADLRGFLADIVSAPGVLDLTGGHLEVTEAAIPDMSVDVSQGLGYVLNGSWTEFSSDQRIWDVLVDADVNVAISSNPSGSTRTDIICLKIDTTVTPNANASNVATIVVVEGTPGAGAPSTPADHLLLATIEVINGATTIPNAKITDDRVQITLKGDLVDANGILSLTSYAPDTFLINGRIVPSVSSNNLTVAIKGMDGNDPSSSNPVYVRIGNTVHTLTSALSVTKNSGTNWFNSGASELATKEIDYFVYLGYNSTDGVVIGFSRIPYASLYSDFSATTTNEKYCAISDISNAVAGDNYINIGRFAATLASGSGYEWTVPTFTTNNLVQKPSHSTRWLTYVPTFTWSGTPPSSANTEKTYYRINGETMEMSGYKDYSSAGTGNTALTITLPFNEAETFTSQGVYGYYNDSGGAGLGVNPSCSVQPRGGNIRIFGTSINADAVVWGGLLPIKIS